MKEWPLFRVSLFVCLAIAVIAGLTRPAAAETRGGFDVTLTMSPPANGTFYEAGETPEVSITLKDASGRELALEELDTLGLYMFGPQDPSKAVTPVKLLNASTDRSQTPHHYIDLLKNEAAEAAGNVVKYRLQPVSDEEAGTYTASLRVIMKGDPPVNQAFFLTDFQMKTDVVEKQIVEAEKCASCHQGAQNGQLYLHHVDPGRSPYGSPSIDFDPVRTCKSCHNNDGYAAYRSFEDQEVRIPDPIIFRVHGVHMGINLKNPKNTDHDKGIFAEYTHVIFPANVKDCKSCHVDDRWKTEPSEFACNACHDNMFYGVRAELPEGMKLHEPDRVAGKPCATCHTAEEEQTNEAHPPIAVSHRIEQNLNEVAVSLTPPANGEFYVAGEKPSVTMVIKDNAGNPIDHTGVTESAFRTAALFVYGPVRDSKPVLTSIAKYGTLKLRASASNYTDASGDTEKGWTFEPGDTFKIAVNKGPVMELEAPAGFQTPDQVKAWLAENLSDVSVRASATSVTIESNIDGEDSRIEIYNSPVTEIMGWKRPGRPMARGGRTPGVTMEPYVSIGSASYQGNDLRELKDPRDFVDPNVTRSVENVTYQLDDVDGLVPGTYMIYVWVQPGGKRLATDEAKDPNFSEPAIGHLTFQVGTAEPEKKVATNCKSCHRENIWHLDTGPQHPEPFDPEYCKACHDYARYNTGNGFDRLGGTSLNGWSGYGAGPLSRRIHGVHFGKYLHFPEEIYAGNPDLFAEAIFPQDVRNCSKCHTEDTTDAWKSEPSRLACMACHDKKSANAHAQLQTLNLTPWEEWDEARVETCDVCHGVGREFSVEKAHNISNPYQPPYPRAGDEGN